MEKPQKPRFETLFPTNPVIVKDLTWRFMTDVRTLASAEREFMYASADKTLASFDAYALQLFGEHAAIYYRMGTSWAHYVLRELHNAQGLVLGATADENADGIDASLETAMNQPADLRKTALDQIAAKDMTFAEELNRISWWATGNGEGVAQDGNMMMVVMGGAAIFNRVVNVLEANGLEADLGFSE